MPNDQSSEEQLRQNALLNQYQEVRSELRQVLDRNHQRAVGGIAAIGVIVGYSLTTNTHLFLVIVPIIMGYLYIIGLGSWMGVRFLAKQSYKVEQAIDVDEFSWETDYGGLIQGNKRHVPGPFFYWNDVPRYATYLSGTFIYLIAVGVSIIVIWNSLKASDLQWFISLLSAIFYIGFTGLLTLVWYSNYRISHHIQEF